MNTLNEDEPSPHALMELSHREHSRLKDNCIHLKDLDITSDGKLVGYKGIEYGKNIKKGRTTLHSKDATFQTDDIYITKIKKNVILITITKDDAIKLLPSLIITSSIYNADPSGYIVLLCAKMKKVTGKDKEWNQDDFKRIKKCKPNILQSSNHHQSSGFYASFGNKGSFAKALSSSVGQYATKKTSTLAKQLIINNEASYYERMTSNEITRSVNNFATVIPTIRSVISPVIETTFELQKDDTNINLKEGLASKDGCWQTSLCVNAATDIFHTEQDCTYTLISIPKQEMINDTNNRYDFIFKINAIQHISIKLIPGVSFIFSGTYLTHRQNMSSGKSNGEPTNFFNIASYGNKRLFTHIRKTISKLNV